MLVFVIGSTAFSPLDGDRKDKAAPYFATGGPDTFGYSFIDSNEIGGTVAFEDISGTGTATGLGDDGETNVNMPFEFDLYGTVSQVVRIGGNGAIMFGQTSGDISPNNTDIPATTPSNLIAAWWDDLDPSDTGAEVYYETRGTAPNRRFIVQWDDMGHFTVGNGPSVTFQIVMYEGTNNIDFVYSDTDFGNATFNNGASATIGLNRNNTDALKYSFNGDLRNLSGVTSIRFTHPDNAVSMSFLSSTVTQAFVGAVLPGSTQQQIIGIEVVVNGNTTPLNITNFDLNTTGTTDAANDISNARIYYTGTSPSFATDVQYGGTLGAPNGTFSISSSRTLVDGTNYFWLAYDIQGGATINNFADAECTQINVGGNRTPTATAPVGSRIISNNNGASCAFAEPIAPSCGGKITLLGNTTGGDTGVNTACGTGGNTVEKIWYSFVGEGGTVTAETIDIGDPNLDDTKLWVYQGSCGGLICVDGNDDTSGFFSSVTFTATEGATYFIVVGGFDAADVGNFQLDITSDACMTYVSSTVTQNSASTISPSTDQDIIGIQVVTAGTNQPIDLTSFSLNTTGTTAPGTDIANAKIYYTGGTNTFSAIGQVGLTEASPNGSFVINGTQELVTGTNYFWLSYDIQPGATDGNFADAQCTQITVDGSNETPSVTSPAGSREIFATVTGINGRRGNALSFDGGDYLETVGYTGISGSNDRTFEAWIRTSSATNQTLMDWGNTGGGSNTTRWLIQVRNTGIIRVNIAGGGNNINGTNSVIDGNWHHIAVVLNGTTLNDVDVYIDGTLETMSASGTTINSGTGNNVRIGTQVNANNFFVGEMDEVRLWDDARTQTEIRENMHLTLTGSEPNLVSYWQFNELTGTIANDFVNTNNGTYGDGSTANTFPTQITSTVAVGSGISNLQTVSGTGISTFTGTNLSLNFTAWAGGSNEFVCYQITGQDAPGNDPLVDIPTLTAVTPDYWVVRQFGNIVFTTNTTFTTGSGSISANDEATPTNLKLISRASNSFSTWSNAGSANLASVASGTVTFNSITSFSQLKVGTFGDSPLPVELTSFTASLENNNVMLHWSTASELNNEGFEVQRSLDGLEFGSIGFVIGNGSTSQAMQYEFMDSNPRNGTLYYRLKQIDFDGHFEFSEVVAVNLTKGFSISAYPNPFKSDLTLSVTNPDRQQVEVNVIGLDGRVIIKYGLEEENFIEQLGDYFTEFPAGVYLLTVKGVDFTLQYKLVKL